MTEVEVTLENWVVDELADDAAKQIIISQADERICQPSAGEITLQAPFDSSVSHPSVNGSINDYYGGKRIPLSAAYSDSNNPGARYASSERGYRNEQGMCPPAMHVYGTSSHPPAGGYFPEYPASRERQSFEGSQMFDPVRGVPKSISIGSSASSQSLEYYGNAHAYEFQRHSYTSGAPSAYHPSYGSQSSGYNTQYHATSGERRRSDPVRGVPRAKSYEPAPHDYVARNYGERSSHRPEHIRGGVGKPDHVRGVARSRSCDASPNNHHPDNIRRGSRRPDSNRHSHNHPPDPVRHVSRSKSYEPVPYHHNNYGNERAEACHHRPSDPVRGVPRSISYEADPKDHHERSSRRPHNNPVDQTDVQHHVPRSISLQSSGDRNSFGGSSHHGRSLAQSHHSPDEWYERGQRQSELSGSMHSYRSAETSSSYEEFATDGTKHKSKRGSKKESFKKELKDKAEKTEEKEESVKDGEMDAYRAMVNASDRTRKKKLNATSYVKVTLGNGMTGYVKAIQQ